jgi:uncharacterized protein YerC
MPDIYTAYTTTVNAEVLESTERVMAVIEQIDTLCIDLENLEQACPVSFRSDVTAVKERALAVRKAVDDETDENTIYKLIKERSAISGPLGTSKIERLGLQEQVIKMRSHGKNYKEIAEQLGLSAELIGRFCKVYDKLTPTDQVKIRSRSIMDFVGHWEEMGALIYRMLARLEGDPENHVRYISELRQLLKNVEAFQSKYTAQQELQQIREVVRDILVQELPAKRSAIMQRFRESGVTKLLPG